MEIEFEKGILDLDRESTINIERTNPLFNEQGSMSLPFSIKRTSRNDFLLDFPHKYERINLFEVKREVNIRSGLLNENASLEILSVDSEKVESVFYLYESSFYSQAKEVKLTTVFDGIERWFQPQTVPREDRMVYILDMLENMIKSIPKDNEEFTIFPAVIKCELLNESLEAIYKATAESKDVLNEVYTHYEPNKDPELRLKGKYAYDITDDDGNVITIPVGYGVTPFLKFGYVLRKIFEYFGLTLEPTIFETDPVFTKWTVLNNTADSVMPGYFIESQFVPDCTVNEFLDIVRESLCSDFIIDVANKTARLVLFNEVLDEVPDMDLTSYLSSPFEKIEYNIPKQVVLTISKSLPFAGTATETFEEFKKKYPEYSPIPPILGANGIFPDYTENSIWKLTKAQEGWLWSTYKQDRLSSMNFDHNTTDDYEREEHKLPYEALGSIYFTTGADHFTHLAPIIGTIRNLNSFVVIDGTKQAEETPECPIMLTLERWNLPNREGIQSIGESSLLLWGTSGFFEKFWKKYDGLSKKSFHQITYNLRMPARLIQSFRFDRLKIVDGQPLFPVSLKYQMQNNDHIDVEMLFKTVKLYGTNAPGEYPLDPEELDYFVGQWHLVPDFEASPLLMFNLLMIQNHSGSINLRNSDGVVVNTTFSGASIKLVITENELEYKVVTLHTEHDPLSFYVMSQQTEPEKKFQLLGDKLGGWVKQG